MKKYLLFLILFSSALINAQTWAWAKAGVGNGTSFDEGETVCADNSGNVFIIGGFNSGIITFGTYTLTNTGNFDVYVVKYDALGNTLWANNIGGINDEYGLSVSADAVGNVYATGYFRSPTLVIGSYTLTNTTFETLFFIKYDSNGNILWVKNAIKTGDDGANAVCTDALGNIYLAGFFTGTTETFGTYTLNCVGGSSMFLTKFDTNGNPLWAINPIDTAGGPTPYAVSVDNSGNAFVAGNFGNQNVFFNTYTLTNFAQQSIFLVKYDSNGNELWAKNPINSGLGFDGALGVTTDPAGNAYITGYFSSPTLVFGTYTLTCTGFQNTFIAKYDVNGNVVWAKEGIGSGNYSGYGICSNANYVYVSGGFDTPITFGTYTLTPATSMGDPMFITSYDFNGNTIYATLLESGGDDRNGICADNFCNVYISGDFLSTAFVVGTTTLSTIYEGIFTAKLSLNCPLSVAQLTLENSKILIFPNPNNGSFKLQIDNEIENGEMILINSLGQKVHEQKISQGQNNVITNNLTSGLYNYIILEDKRQICNGKLAID